MILGEHNRDNDLEVNPLKGKKLTNIRAAGKDEAVVLTTPARPTLEQAIAYVEDDELVEVTPAPHPPAQAPPRPARAQAAVAADRLVKQAWIDGRDLRALRILRNRLCNSRQGCVAQLEGGVWSPSDCGLITA